MHVELKGQVFGSGQGHAGGRDAFNRRVTGQVHEQDGTVDGTGATEVIDEIVGFLESDAHRGKDNSEIAGTAADLGLAGDLGSELGMRQTGSRENRQLLAADEGVQAIDRRNAGLDKFVRVVAGGWIHRLAVDIEHPGRDDRGSTVLGLAHAVENAAEDVRGQG